MADELLKPGEPAKRVIEAAFRFPDDGEYLVVSRRLKTEYPLYSEDTIRVFKGKDLQDLHEIPVNYADYYRDTGSILCHTKEGALEIPSQTEKEQLNEKPTWKVPKRDGSIGYIDTELTELNIADVAHQIGTDARIIGVENLSQASVGDVSTPATEMGDASAKAAITSAQKKGKA